MSQPITQLPEIFTRLHSLLEKYQPPLVSKSDTEKHFDLWSKKEVIIANRPRSEVFFAAIMPHKGYIGFYYMPVYTNEEANTFFDPELLKLKKGKSCFHIKKLDTELEKKIRDVLEKGFKLYQQQGWI